MRITITEAEGQLAELVKRAERGEEIVLLRPDLPPVRLEVVQSTAEGQHEFHDAAVELAKLVPPASRSQPLSAEEKRKAFDEIRRMALGKDRLSGPDAAHSQDFLYDDFGLPK